MLIVASNMHIVTSNMRNMQEQLRDPHALWRAQARQREIAATRPARLKTARPLRQPSDGGGGGGGDGGGGGKHKQGQTRKQHVAAQAALRAQQALRAASQAAQAARERVKRHEDYAWDPGGTAHTTKAAPRPRARRARQGPDYSSSKHEAETLPSGAGAAARDVSQ